MLFVLELDLPSLKAADALLATLLDVTFLAISSHYSSFGEGLAGLFQAPLLIMGFMFVSDVAWAWDEFGVHIKFIGTFIASAAKRNNVVLLIVASDFLDVRPNKVACPFLAVRCTASIRFSLGLILPVSKPT